MTDFTEKLFIYHICWQYCAQNFEYGLVKAVDLHHAEQKIKEAHPNIQYCPDITEVKFDENDMCEVYSS